MEAWNSPACSAFYTGGARHSTARLRAQLGYNGTEVVHSNAHDHHNGTPQEHSQRARDRLRLPLIVAREDQCNGGRVGAMQPPKMRAHIGNEIVIVPQLNVAYVEVRKCGSDAVRSALLAGWGVSFRRCGDKPVPAHCARPLNPSSCTRRDPPRCTSRCLTEADVSRLFFFSFVREPNSRFWSAYVQSLIHQSLVGPVDWRAQLSVAGVNTSLHDLHGPNCSLDIHLESMTMSLSTPYGDRGHRLPLDYIGRVSTLAEDFERALLTAANVTGIMPERSRMERALKMLRVPTQVAPARIKQGLAAARNESSLVELVRSAYEQDTVCLFPPANRSLW